MRKMLIVLALLMSVSTSFSQVDPINAIGWRNGVLHSYCEEYDLMVDNNRQWVLPWDANRQVVKYALARDGYTIEETDSTISWKVGEILKYEIQFTDDSKIKNVGIIIFTKVGVGFRISDALMKKLEAIHREKGKFRKTEGSGTSYTWHDTTCSKGIVTMMSTDIINKEYLVITQYSAQIR